MVRTWVEQEGLRRSRADIEKLQVTLAQMLAKRTQVAESSSDPRQDGYTDCLRNALKNVEASKLELDVYDAQFTREEQDDIGTVLRIGSSEKLEKCREELKTLYKIKLGAARRFPTFAEYIDREIEKVKEIALILGYNTYEIGIAEQRVTTRLVLAKKAKYARTAALAGEGIVIDIDDAATTAREPRVFLDGREITSVEMNAE